MMKARGNKKGNREWGMGNGEWGMGMGKQVPCPHSPFPTPHSFLALLALFAFFASALAQDRPISPPPASSPATSKAEGSSDRLFRLTLPPLSNAGPRAGLKSGQIPMSPDESRSEAKKLWGAAEDLRATGAVESLRAAMSKYEDAL